MATSPQQGQGHGGKTRTSTSTSIDTSTDTSSQHRSSTSSSASCRRTTTTTTTTTTATMLLLLLSTASRSANAFLSVPTRRLSTTKMMGVFGGISSQPFATPNTPGPATQPPKSDPSIDLPEFRKLGLSEDVLDALKALNIKEPSAIQRLAIPAALKGDDLAFSAATGSGKTLAYLLPIMQQLKWQEVNNGKARQACRPRALILVPTRELVTQVLEVTKQLSHVVKLSSCGLHGGEDFGIQRRRLQGMVDIVVASPGRLLQHYEKGHVFFSQVTTVVVDEMDTMLKDGFGPDLKRLMVPLEQKSKRDKVNYLMATATLTPAVKKLMEAEGFPKTRFLQSEDAHKSLPTLRHVMLDTKGGDKVQLLLDILSTSRQKEERVMIFCNTVQSCRAAEHALKEISLNSVCYHGDMHSEERASSLEKFKSGEVSFLVCTDIASRGLDMPFVEHVVMFDFPLNPIEYLHRSGRTARMGAKGKVTSLLAKRDKVLASAIQTAVAKGLPLDSLSARKRDYEAGGKLSGLSKGTVGSAGTTKKKPGRSYGAGAASRGSRGSSGGSSSGGGGGGRGGYGGRASSSGSGSSYSGRGGGGGAGRGRSSASAGGGGGGRGGGGGGRGRR